MNLPAWWCHLLSSAHALPKRMLLTVIPFALLANSSAVLLTMRIESDGSALRQISLSAAPYFRSQLGQWANDVRLGSRTNWDGHWQQTTESDLQYARDARLASLKNLGEEASLTITDVFQNPLSLYTVYHWREQVNFTYLYATDQAAALAMDKKLKYEIIMPGTVVTATVQGKGSRGQAEGQKAVFELDASEGSQTLEAESYSLRWGYLLVIAYILAFVGYRLGRVIAYQLRIRPRKI